jgi:hypothetical protein
MEKSNPLFAKIVSVLFHPLLMPTYALIILFNSNTHFSYLPFEVKKMMYLIVFLCTFLIPVSTIPFLVNLKVVSGPQLKNHRERIIPLAISALSFYFAYHLLNKYPLSTIEFVKVMLLASAILIFICLLITLKWKISAHLIGTGGLLAGFFFYAVYFVADFTMVLVVISLLAGIIAYSRLKLQVHNSAQVYSGFLLGFFGMLLVLYLGLN